MALTFAKTKLTFYETCEDMPLWNFQKYLETSDLKYFTEELKNHKDLDDVMTRFYGDYLNKTNNASIINRFGIIHKILRLTSKFNTVSLIIHTLYNFPKNGNIEKFEEMISQLEKWNYKIEKNKDIFEQLEKISNRILGIKTQIQLLEDEIKTNDKEESVTIESQLITTSRILELGYKLNAKEISVLEWIEYQKQAESEIIARNKNK